MPMPLAVICLIVGLIFWFAIPGAFAGAVTVGIILTIVGAVLLVVPYVRQL